MSDPIDPKLKDILQSLTAKKPAQVQHLLAKACANDESLMADLQALMSDSDIQTLQQNTEQDIADWQDLEATITPGEMIGPYKVAHQIGEGGMGVVVKAEQQEPIQRTVAVKIIKQGMSSRQVLRRFQMEQQTLGNMNHPYIAQVYDAGVTDNKRPYFVMEYIEGTPLTQFCDDQKLDLHERLNLFDKVCDGIRYAHQRGIVHRDLKPANILVFESEGKFIPKIIDFGIAKALHTSPEAGQTMLTAWGTTMGSPGYMSPEQARTNEVEIDTRTDVYALGVILYELATGFLPISPDQWYIKSLDEMLDIIINKPAPKPSELLKDSKDQLAEILPNRATTYAKLHRAINGDLDWIILKAVEKEQNRRYSTAAELQNDVDNYLKGMPVLAGPPGVGYQLKKFVSRNKLPVAAFSLFMLALIGGIVGTTQGFLKAKKEAKSTQQTLDLLQEFLASPTPYKNGEDVKVIELLHEFTEKIRKDESIAPEVAGSIKRTITNSYVNVGQFKKGLEIIEESIAQLEMANLDDTELYFRSQGTRAYIYGIEQKPEKALEIYEPVLEYMKKSKGKYSVDSINFNNRVALMYLRLNRLEDSKKLFDDMLSPKAQLKKTDLAEYFNTKHNYAYYLNAVRKHEEAILHYNEALEYYENKFGKESTVYISTLKQIGNTYYDLKEQDKALEVDKEALRLALIVYGDSHPRYLSQMHNMATTYYLNNELEKAEELYVLCSKRVLEVRGPENPRTASVIRNTARFFQETGRPETSLIYVNQIIDLQQSFLGQEHIIIIDTYRIMALCFLELDKIEEAHKLLTKQLEVSTKAIGKDHPLTLRIHQDLAEVYRLKKQPADFQYHFLQYISEHGAKFGFDNPPLFRSISKVYKSFDHSDSNIFLNLEFTNKIINIYTKELGENSAELHNFLALTNSNEKSLNLKTQENNQ